MTPRQERGPDNADGVMTAESRSLGIVMGTGSLYVESSGTYVAVKGLAQTLGQQGHDVTVVGTRDRWSSPEPAGYGPARASAFRKVGPRTLHYAPGLGRWLASEPPPADVVALQGLWLHSNYRLGAVGGRQGHTLSDHARGNPEPRGPEHFPVEEMAELPLVRAGATGRRLGAPSACAGRGGRHPRLRAEAADSAHPQWRGRAGASRGRGQGERHPPALQVGRGYCCTWGACIPSRDWTCCCRPGPGWAAQGMVGAWPSPGLTRWGIRPNWKGWPATSV